MREVLPLKSQRCIVRRLRVFYGVHLHVIMAVHEALPVTCTLFSMGSRKMLMLTGCVDISKISTGRDEK